MSWKHDDLAADLAAHLRGGSDRLVWTDMQLGPAGSPRPDVYTVPCSFARFQPIAYEVKISVADFRRDVTAGKWTSYLRYSAGVVFCVPAGLIKKEDVPTGCGLMTRGEAGWRSVKGPTLKAVDNLPRDAWIKLLIDGLGRLRTVDADTRSSIRDAYSAQLRLREKLGADVGDLLAKRANARYDFELATDRVRSAADDANREYRRIVDAAKERAREDSATVDAARADLARVLGLESDAAAWQIQDAARRAAARLNANAEIERLQQQFRAIEYALEQVKQESPALLAADELAIES
ncbi:MAG TPA: hypothetical protein VF534_01285 [Paraburkholderia sp.]